MRYLGIDFGLRKIGLSLGDDGSKIASPIETVKNDEHIFSSLSQLVEHEGVESIVVGVPVQDNPAYSTTQLDLTHAFIEELHKYISLPIHQIDERYTTSESKRLKKEFGAQAPEDSLSAMIILQSYFDELG
ncbi:Holliday junction resolvase RuvX [Patescibacteria group bacterium]|nr:Holliday junction resolvase RuvX [Patescibacteria group bacterium]MBU4452701.1 Holliday junction resolvase RuvX [Patescibacteria group bacterium]MCG2687605.1 Holliday junction resolvase RuvX [Candidatus Parcubacteria bacterium]